MWAHLDAGVPSEKCPLAKGDAAAIRKMLHIILEVDDPEFDKYNDMVTRTRLAQQRAREKRRAR